MEWNEKLQIIIDYVEEHLQCIEESIVEDEIAKIAGCSFNFFQKVFSYMNRISFSEYVRSRKMTLAGYDLKSSFIKVIDLSYKYGYQSPTSFTKAFQSFHGVSPSLARSEQVSLKVYPKMKINIDQKYQWRVSEKPSIRLLGKCVNVSTKGNQHYQDIPKFWNDSQRNGTFFKLITLDEAKIKGMFGIFFEEDRVKKEKKYGLMVESSSKQIDDFETFVLPAALWAVFDCYGPPPLSIQAGWRYLEEEWIVKYPFKHANIPALEWYSEGNVYDQKYLSQIWIPIIEEEV